MAEQTDNPAEDARVSELYAELNRREPLSPPPSVDAAILAEAHRAVSAKPRPARSPVYRWAPPVAMAATVVLTATLVLLVPHQESDPTRDIVRTSAQDSEQSEQMVRKKESRSQSAAAVAQSPAINEPMPVLTSKSVPIDQAAGETLEREALVEEIIVSRNAEQGTTGISTDTLQTFSAMMESDLGEQKRAETELDSVPAPAAEVTSGLVDSDAESEDSAVMTPKEWREHIEMLLENNEWEKAEEEFERFESAYPNDEYVEIYTEEKAKRARDSAQQK